MVKDTIVIAGAVAQKPWVAGHTWVFLQYLLGFKKLGWDVVFVDQLEPEMCFNREGHRCSFEESVNVEYFVRVMEEFGLDGSYALLYDSGRHVVGLQRAQLTERVTHAALLLNVMGFLRDEQILSIARKRVFLDIDPGFGQMWQELGLCSMFDGHDAYVTIAEHIGQKGCSVPTCGVSWTTSRQPVQLDYWKPNGDSTRRPFTTIASWRGSYNPIEFRGKTYGLRVHEFRKLAPLPKSTGKEFDIALDIHPADRADKVLLETNGWRIMEPRTVSGDPSSYQRFIRDSAAEFMVAKNMYVETQSGWFSDRSSCYLASGKPVLAQDTGLKALYPVGEGLLTFTSLEEAISGVEEICRNYAAHARAARAIAVDYFDSDKVLRSLLAEVL
jgi:hypothetical protein